MPPSPSATRTRLLGLGLSERDADVLMSIDAGKNIPFDGEPSTTGAVAYFDRVAERRDPKLVANWYDNLKHMLRPSPLTVR